MFFGPGGQGRIRTPVARKERQIYSLLPLATRPPVRFRVAGEKARWGAAFSRAFFFAWFRGSLIATGLTHSPMRAALECCGEFVRIGLINLLPLPPPRRVFRPSARAPSPWS